MKQSKDCFIFYVARQNRRAGGSMLKIISEKREALPRRAEIYARVWRGVPTCPHGRPIMVTEIYARAYGAEPWNETYDSEQIERYIAKCMASETRCCRVLEEASR
jgi:hypothetical protein